MSTVAFASKDTTLAGFSGVPAAAVSDEGAETEQESEETAQTEVQETEAAQTEAQETEAPQTEAAQTEVQETEPVVDTSMSGEMAFAQCDEYINIRSGASTDSEVVGKVYNNGSVTILSQVGDWYEVQSGNATGYVKTEYFATGAEADAIAEEVAYNVATVYPEALVVRAEASEDSEQIGMVYSTDELEVVEYEGDWMKVALGDGVYGYVSAYYVGYDTYYATAETLEEEQARLDQEWLDYLAQQEAEQAAAEQAYLDAIAAEQAAAEQAAADAAAQAQAEAQAVIDSQAQQTADAQAAAEQAYQEYLDAQAAADAATQQADEQAVYDTAAQAQAEYQEYLNAQAAADAQAQQEANASAQAQADAEAAAQAAADAAAQAQAEADAAASAGTEDTSADSSGSEESYEDTSSSSSTLGQEIVNFAVQFVGNPYVWGGTSLTNGADCSGFTQSVFANFGISIPRTAAAQSGSGTPVDLGSIQAGDLLFYSGGSGIGHVTIYMGNGQVVHASNSNTGIIISDYGYRTPVSARRYW
ncbi:MAG TPA: C40 family peptidase [Candidatus Choladousia intestinipullorum]|nr:C40 family peptidase [Candidatus Choladousia intestinipullorum]